MWLSMHEEGGMGRGGERVRVHAAPPTLAPPPPSFDTCLYRIDKITNYRDACEKIRF